MHKELSNEQSVLLRRLRRKGGIPYTPQHNPLLDSMPGLVVLVSSEPNENGYPSPSHYVITNDGIAWLEKEKEIRREKRVESRRFTITTLIALIALLVAIVGLLSDIGLLSLPQVPRPILQPVSIDAFFGDLLQHDAQSLSLR